MQAAPLQYRQTMSSWTLFSAQSQCHGGTGLGTLVFVKDDCNATVHKYFLYNYELCGSRKEKAHVWV